MVVGILLSLMVEEKTSGDAATFSRIALLATTPSPPRNMMVKFIAKGLTVCPAVQFTISGAFDVVTTKAVSKRGGRRPNLSLNVQAISGALHLADNVAIF
jgi:hypothetical protein